MKPMARVPRRLVAAAALLVGVMYLLGAVCAWRLIARHERREAALAAAEPARA